MSTNSLPADVRNQLRLIIEQKYLTKILLSAVKDEYFKYHRSINRLRNVVKSSKDILQKAQFMQEAQQNYITYQKHLVAILEQAKTINHE